MLGIPSSKFLNLVKEIDTESAPQRRFQCTPPHNSRKYDECPRAQPQPPEAFLTRHNSPEHARTLKAPYNEDRTPKRDTERARTIRTLCAGNQFLKGSPKHEETLRTTPYLDIPEGCVIVDPQSARFFAFSNCLLKNSHAMYLVSNKVASFFYIYHMYNYLRIYHLLSTEFELLKTVWPGRLEKCQIPVKPF